MKKRTATEKTERRRENQNIELHLFVSWQFDSSNKLRRNCSKIIHIDYFVAQQFRMIQKTNDFNLETVMNVC